MKAYSVRTESKFIVFFTQLLTLFQICRECKCEDTLTEVNAHGTMAEVTPICVNPGCGKRTRSLVNLSFQEQKLQPVTCC